MTLRRPRRSVAAVALASLCLLVVPTLALGHAELDTANPAEKWTVPPPCEVVMTFTEALDPSASSIKLAVAVAVAVAIGGHRDIDVLHGRPHPDRRGIDRVGRPWCLAASGPRPPRRVR